MPIHIESFQVTNYRSCRNTRIPLHPRLSALIGPNGSGKSNILHSILMLRRIARTTRPHADEDFPLSACKLALTFRVRKKALPYKALVKFSTSDRNIDDVIDVTQKWNFREFTAEDSWISLPFSALYEPPYGPYFLSGLSGKRRARFLRQLSLFSGEKPVRDMSWEAVYRILQQISDLVVGITYYSASQFTDPSRCPPSFDMENDKPLRRAHRAGAEHVQFMYDLYSAFKDNKAEFEEFRSIVGPDGVGLVDSIKYDEIEVPSSVLQVATGARVIRREVERLLVIPNFQVKGSKLSPSQLSEGTFKTLALIFYLVTDQSRLLLLEEPEVCIHHGLLASVIEIVKSFSKRKQIVISTHSDFVLDSLEPDNVFLVTNEAEKGTKVKHLPKAMSSNQYGALKAYLEETGNLGEYWRHGDLEK